ncbi:CD97 antigen isoform X1 [Tupaia chinensis]|uniref:CD97 antigen isoform X1 n=1 Tax=Tupaia chinensis TaxID=246437 RepID=UPI0007045C3D|nr:CD97 antigen isoform X1 [Tupaia chinensis]
MAGVLWDIGVALCVLLSLSGAGTQSAPGCALWCPRKSSCINATACRCNPGFSSTSGEIFTNILESCDDINECAPPMAPPCGKLADCVNTEGSFYCMCNPGYGLSSGAKTFRNESENTCQDIDECQQNRKLCKPHGVCVNTPGSYTCRCLPGFALQQKGPMLCADVNECTSGQNPCHNTTHCLNTVGSYECRCRPGWTPAPGSPNGPNTTICEDVDECRSGQHQCHVSTVCINSVGSYRCRCRQGWKLKTRSLNNQTARTNQTKSVNQSSVVCEATPFSTLTWLPGIDSQILSWFFDKIQNLSSDVKPDSAKDTMQSLINSVDELMETLGDMETLPPHVRHRMATHLLSGLEDVLRSIAGTLPEGPFTYRSPSKTELSLMVQERGTGNVTVGQSHARVMLDWAVAAGDGGSGRTVVGVLSSNMTKLLANASFDMDPETQKELEEFYESPVRGARLRLLSPVNSVFLSNKNTKRLDSLVTFAFSHDVDTPKTRQELICAFWKNDSERGGHWATEGCRKLGSRNGSTTCQCNHLSSFAILVAHYDVEDPKLALFTKVGLSLSLICLLLCILTFLLVRPIQSSRTTVHLHLCICLFVGSAVFLAGIENEGGEVGLRCRLVAGLLHYCFLAAFCWMSLEGLELYFLVVRVFRGQGLRTRWLCLIGYGVPLFIVAVSVAVKSQCYGHELYCWLRRDGGFLWSFLGPVTVIVLCNSVIFVTTVWKLTQKFSEINPDMKKLKKARALTVTAVAQLIVLGCTWVFGLVLFDPHSWVLAYVFSVLNCLQGVFLFVLHCLLNKKVREEYRKWACLVVGNKYSEFSSSSTGTGQQQTRVLRPSESGM